MHFQLRALGARTLLLTTAAALAGTGIGSATAATASTAASADVSRPAVAVSSAARTWALRRPSLRRNVGTRTPFTIATFNMLGASHTAPGGNKRGWADGATRASWAVDVLESHRADVIGFQEMQAVQARTFSALAGFEYGVFSPPNDTENSIAWNRAVFTLVRATTQPIPYFEGHVRHMPVVLLRANETGQYVYVVNVHNPADTRQHPHNARWRAVATRREVALVRTLRSHGRPVFVTGDMNDSRRAFCRFTASGDLHAAAGGTHVGGCRAPAYRGIDWIFGSTGTRFSTFAVDRSPLVRRTTDHPVVFAQVR